MLALVSKDNDDRGPALDDKELNMTKIFGDTNPLSALLRNDLKYKIVNGLCAFRTPDPRSTLASAVPSRCPNSSRWLWEQAYSELLIHPVKLEYLKSLGCFELPPQETCGQLLDIYFSRIHPLLPVMDRAEFLSRYYSSDDPPPLILQLAVFLAASRYTLISPLSTPSGDTSIRERCDLLHTKLQALCDIDLIKDRLPAIQANLLASLHWEGREGINSASDCLSLAIRLAHELGLHRRRPPNARSRGSQLSGEETLLKKVWWCLYALDRFNAAQEGTPLLINEIDCDVEPLTTDDLLGEDLITTQTTLYNVSLSLILETAMRSFYSVKADDSNKDWHTRLEIRDRLSGRLDLLCHQISMTLGGGQPAITTNTTVSSAMMWSLFLQTHLNAVRILIQRPFLTYLDPSTGTYPCRVQARRHSDEIIHNLNVLRSKNLLRFSWPFTIFSIVSAMLIYWYDVNDSGFSEQKTIARSNFELAVECLGDLSGEWWAAAAKHMLGKALLRIADSLQVAKNDRGRQAGAPNGVENMDNVEEDGGQESEDMLPDAALEPWVMEPWALDNEDLWQYLGLDFERDVAQGIFTILEPNQRTQ
ncbi:uncharacterized protein Z518_07041 [Rhinocladiella mackenziei CBS 650.93]|uniref:Xylanolytic transcriptional activator regulatory domain-containing protein n=1 Tax=Rhinocladiella mackenziei CBS 650.93 TaxID=1442369 RepID=A0A0D2GZB1_9EURO|nr:uncharacterized protein Z518_07041 [Rhinocladiella mackenziei CBS 650.93]KIX03488.1 hypothetical protein Z518_07041 [Rhinocladiella mackenziei CBS 650.93]